MSEIRISAENKQVSVKNLGGTINVKDKQGPKGDTGAAGSGTVYNKRIIVTQPSDLLAIDSSAEYFIDGVVDMGVTPINVPAGGLSIKGYNFNISKLISNQTGYVMFIGADGGDLLLHDVAIEVTGTSSSAFGLKSATGNEAVEIHNVNFNSCTSLGYLDNYRQVLETDTGRFLGTPELELRGVMDGYRQNTSIARGLSNLTSLFKAGLGLSFSGRFATDINCDLPATGALLDFSESHFITDESLIIKGAYVTRSGILDTSDTAITPNIVDSSVKSLWTGNAGIPDTTKYIKTTVTVEVETPVADLDTYYPLLGTQTVEIASHFDMPANGELRSISGNGKYLITGDIGIIGTQNDVIDVRITKSTDGGLTWPTQINHLTRQVNALTGPRDLAWFPINFIHPLKNDDRIRLEVKDETGNNNVTMELDSYLIISSL